MGVQLFSGNGAQPSNSVVTSDYLARDSATRIAFAPRTAHKQAAYFFLSTDVFQPDLLDKLQARR